jgi:hypothetical protein
MSEQVNVPDDLKILFEDATEGREYQDSSQRTNEVLGLIERIAALEAENAALRTQVERLSAPVTDAEWVEYCVSNDDGMTWASVRRDDISALLAARKGAAMTEQVSVPDDLKLIAFSLWAAEKCTTKYGTDVDDWNTMPPSAKSAWMKLAKEKMAEWKEARMEKQ